MFRVSALDRKTDEEIRFEWVEREFVGRWVDLFLSLGFKVIVI